MLLRQCNHPLKELQLYTVCSGVSGEVEDQHLGTRPRVFDRLLQLIKEVLFRVDQWHMADIGTRNDEAIGVDRVGRVRHQYGIARPYGC